jgi:hypothetical protein
MDTLVSDHAGLDVLPYAEYLRLLAHAPLGRISFMIDGDVVIMPVNHGLDAAWCSAPLPAPSCGWPATPASSPSRSTGTTRTPVADAASSSPARAEQVLDDAAIARLGAGRAAQAGRRRPAVLDAHPR